MVCVEIRESETSKTRVGRNSRMSVAKAVLLQVPLSRKGHSLRTRQWLHAGTPQPDRLHGASCHCGFWGQTLLGLNSQLSVSLMMVPFPQIHSGVNSTFVDYKWL